MKKFILLFGLMLLPLMASAQYIYDRNGLLVYSTTDPTAGWTPADSNPQGVYAYSLRCRFNNRRIKIFTGSVLVIK